MDEDKDLAANMAGDMQMSNDFQLKRVESSPVTMRNPQRRHHGLDVNEDLSHLRTKDDAEVD